MEDLFHTFYISTSYHYKFNSMFHFVTQFNHYDLLIMFCLDMSKRVETLANSMAVRMTLDDEERESIHNILNETDDDETPPLQAVKTNYKQVVVCAENKKFTPKNRITGPDPLPVVPQPVGTTTARPKNVSVRVKNVPVNHAPSLANGLPQGQRPPSRLPATLRLRQRPTPYTRPQIASPAQPATPLFFPIPPPKTAPQPKYSPFMINSLCSNLIMHSADNFNIKLDETEVKEFLNKAKKSYT